jgi:hypothetical protein
MKRLVRDLNLCTLTILVGLAMGASAMAQPREERAAIRSDAEVVDPAVTVQSVVVTIWMLELTEATGPEADELEAALREKANDLPLVIGRKEEVRDLIARLKVAGMLHKSRVVRLLTTDGELASAQTGADQPTIVQSNTNELGLSNTIQFRHVGMEINARPVIETGGTVQLKFQYNASRIDTPEEIVITEPQGKKPIYATQIVSRGFESVLRVKNGIAVAVSTDSLQATSAIENASKTELLLIAAETLPTQ